MEYREMCDSEKRARWLAVRRTGIGSSDAAAVIGCSPFKSALAVYAEKIGESDEEEETEYMKWGRILEPHILSEFAAETKRVVKPAGRLLASNSLPYMLATLDGVQLKGGREDPGVAEAKHTAYRVGDWEEGVPVHVMAQVQHQLFVTGMQWGSVIVLQNGCRLLWADVERDERFIGDVLLPACSEFWDRVQRRSPPAPDGSESSRKALAALYPEAVEGKVIELPGHLAAVDEQLYELSEERKYLEKQERALRQELQAAIGDAERAALSNGVSYTYKTQNLKGYTVEPKSFRVLRRYAPKVTR